MSQSLMIEIEPSRYSSKNSTFDLTIETANSGVTKTGLTVDDLVKLRDAIEARLATPHP